METSSFDFSFVDEQKYVKPLRYVPVNTSRGYWEFTVTEYLVGEGSVVENSFQSIADTGTTLMLLPHAAVKAYYAYVPGAENNETEGGFVFP
jgi:aspergillopepsin I